MSRARMEPSRNEPPLIGNPLPAALGFLGGGVLLVACLLLAVIVYWTTFRIDVPTGSIAVLTAKTGQDLPNDAEVASDASFKGLQQAVLAEGRHFRNPWYWDWEVVPQVIIPEGKIGVRIRLYGDEPGYGHVVAWSENEKGIVPDVLVPGRHPLNAKVIDCTGGGRREVGLRRRENYVEMVELHNPVTIPGGYVGVVTNLSAPLPKDTNQLLSETGKRGVEPAPLGPGTYILNPYVTRVSLVDCRSQRFNLNADGDMGFPSKDGFWVTLDGVIEFRVKETDAPQLFVVYNELENDQAAPRVDEEIIKKIVLPNARSFCRLRGSDHSGRDFISGETRKQFQDDFQKDLASRCGTEGVEIVQALITKIYPPQQIAEPVRMKQIAVEQRQQYARQLLQQESEKKLAIEGAMNERKQSLVETEKKVVQVVTESQKEAEVSLIEAQQRLTVAQLELQAAEDLAAAVLSRGQAEAKVVEFGNQAEAAGWKKAVAAYGGSGDEYARGVMLKKLAPAYRSLMVNTADSPIMDIFRQFEKSSAPPANASPAPPAPPAAPSKLAP